jgi:cytochrome c oxidase cbb3-type subunit 2
VADDQQADGELTGKKLALFRDHFGVPYTDADIQGAKAAVQGKTEMEALIAYLQQLGRKSLRCALPAMVQMARATR